MGNCLGLPTPLSSELRVLGLGFRVSGSTRQKLALHAPVVPELQKESCRLSFGFEGSEFRVCLYAHVEVKVVCRAMMI